MTETLKKIAITGASGVVGTALTERLIGRYDIVPINVPDIDILRDQEKLDKALAGVDTVIHLAGVFGPAHEGHESWRSPHQNPVNKQLFDTVLKASQYAGVDKIIHASSIHVEDTMTHYTSGSVLNLRAPDGFSTEPVSGYGYAKRAQEKALESSHALFPGGAVSIRLGGVRPNNMPLTRADHSDESIVDHEQKVWLEHGDLADLVGRIIDYEQPVGYDVVYAVSNNTGRFHETSNRYGWQPTANSADSL